MIDTDVSRKKDGFAGQLAIVLPKSIIEICAKTAPIHTMYITDLGFYPKAKFHYRERPDGVSQNILIYCVDGKGWAQIGNDKRVSVQAGEFLIIPDSTPHVYGADENQPWSIFWMHFNGEMASSVSHMARAHDGSHVNSIAYDEERIRLFNEMYYTLDQGYSQDNLVYANMTLWRFMVSFVHGDKFLSAPELEEKNPVKQSIDFMNENLHRTLKLSDFTDFLNMSTSHYSAIFKKKTGYSPIDYFNHLKIQQACRYLQFTELRIGEISLKLGFEDQYYFSRLFSNIMDCPPVQYRKKRQRVS